MKAALVSTASLARLAEGLDLGQHLLLGRGEEKTGGRRKQALLADVYEAFSSRKQALVDEQARKAKVPESGLPESDVPEMWRIEGAAQDA